ncbi:MAG TPA: hypothetical protein VL737_02315 [Candidatus Pristimantibacillus sp.]|nr:hypothetical protein [Candidatus Pristimantibacillus sp.]
MGHKKTPNQPTDREIAMRARSMQDRAKLRNETPPAEVAKIFGAAALATENAYHWSIFGDPSEAANKVQTSPNPDELLNSPVSDSLTAAHPDNSHLLTQNQSFYDDPVEDRIADDPVVQALQPLSRHGNPEVALQAMDALRARRTVLAALGHLGLPTGQPPAQPEQVAA